jgi:hypothetical protein
MASYQALAAVGVAIRELLAERYPRGEFGSLDIELVQPRDIENGLSGEGVGILPWRLAVDTRHRASLPRTDVPGTRLRPPLPVDLSFLLLPYSARAEKQLRMLGWVMRAIEDAGVLTAAQLNKTFGENPVFVPGETVELLCDPLSVTDQLSMWTHMRGHPPIGACYVARTVLLDSVGAT